MVLLPPYHEGRNPDKWENGREIGSMGDREERGDERLGSSDGNDTLDKLDQRWLLGYGRRGEKASRCYSDVKPTSGDAEVRRGEQPFGSRLVRIGGRPSVGEDQSLEQSRMIAVELE